MASEHNALAAKRLRDRPRAVVAAITAFSLLVVGAACWRAADAEGSDAVDRAGAGAGTPGGSEDDRGRSTATRVLASAIELLRAGDAPAMEIGAAWFLQQLALQRSDADLRALVADTAKRLTNHPQARLLRPEAAALPLPEDPGHGIMRLATYVSAPTGQPPARALEFIDAFTATPATGYVLTHQFLVLEWARHVGLAMPERLWERRGGLLERIAAEQAVDHQFSDLFAERAAILLAFSAPASGEADRWIDLIAAAQTGDGRWTSPRSLITYDGQQAPANHPWVHTTGFVAAASGFYLQGRGTSHAPLP